MVSAEKLSPYRFQLQVINKVCPIGQHRPEWKQRDVREGFIRNSLSLCPKAFDNVIDLDSALVKRSHWRLSSGN